MLLEVHGMVVAGNRLLRLRGELDIATAPELATAIDAELALSGQRFGLDLSELRFVDSSGVRALVHGSWRAEQQGCQMFLFVPAANRAVGRVFDLLGLQTVLSIVDTLVPDLPGLPVQALPVASLTPPPAGGGRA